VFSAKVAIRMLMPVLPPRFAHQAADRSSLGQDMRGRVDSAMMFNGT